MNEYISEMILNGETYTVRAFTLEEYVVFSRSAILKTLVKAPFKITPQNIEKLSPDGVFSLMASVLLLTSNMLNREVMEFQKVKRI